MTIAKEWVHLQIPSGTSLPLPDPPVFRNEWSLIGHLMVT